MKNGADLAYTKSVKKTRTGETKMEHKYPKEGRKFDFKTVAILILSLVVFAWLVPPVYTVFKYFGYEVGVLLENVL